MSIFKQKYDSFFDTVNARMKGSYINRYFEIEERNSTFLQEIRAGIVCFLTVCYIIPVNAGILADTGGTCVPAIDCNADRYAMLGDDCKFDAFGTNPEWGACISAMKQNLIAATCIASMLSTLGMALWARMPMAVAPAMGVNAYFSYTVVGFMGTGMISYQAALAAAFIEGWIFILISVSGARRLMMELIPKSLMYATAAGIGAFLAFIGLEKGEGIGLITFDGATLVTLGGCTPDEIGHMYSMRDLDAYWLNFCWGVWRSGVNNSTLSAFTDQQAKAYFVNVLGLSPPFDPAGECSSNIFGFGVGAAGSPAPDVFFGLPPQSNNYTCFGKQLKSLTMWLGIFGGMLMVILMCRGVSASILWGILFVTFISWCPYPNETTFFGAESTIPGGQQRFDFFLKGGQLPSVKRTGGKLDFAALRHGDTWVALITFLYLDFMDATSVMFTLAGMVAEKVPGFRNEKGEWPRQMQTMAMDGLSIVIGSTLGTSPLTVFAESAIGVREGGRTGLTAFMVAFGFGISMFLAPIFASIPPYATGPAIVLVGALMMEHAAHVEWEDPRKAVPAFLTILLMPLTYSVAYGVIAGVTVTIFLWICCFILDIIAVVVWREGNLRHVWLDNCSSFYCAFNKEQVLIDELPGYVSTSAQHLLSHMGKGEADMVAAEEMVAAKHKLHQDDISEEDKPAQH